MKNRENMAGAYYGGRQCRTVAKRRRGRRAAARRRGPTAVRQRVLVQGLGGSSWGDFAAVLGPVPVLSRCYRAGSTCRRPISWRPSRRRPGSCSGPHAGRWGRGLPPAGAAATPRGCRHGRLLGRHLHLCRARPRPPDESPASRSSTTRSPVDRPLSITRSPSRIARPSRGDTPPCCPCRPRRGTVAPGRTPAPAPRP